jgi:hypothetical protein
MGANAYLGSHDIGDIALLETSDIGGTNAQAGEVDMRDWHKVFAYVEIGTWNSTDDLDECRLEQGDGSSWKDLTTDAAGGNYDTDNPVDADGNFVILEATDEDLDVANGFYLVRLYVAEAGNTGVDNVTGFIFGCGAKIKAAQKNGAAVTGEKVYVRPS